MATYIIDFALNGQKFYNGKVLPIASSLIKMEFQVKVFQDYVPHAAVTLLSKYIKHWKVNLIIKQNVLLNMGILSYFQRESIRFL